VSDYSDVNDIHDGRFTTDKPLIVVEPNERDLRS